MSMKPATRAQNKSAEPPPKTPGDAEKDGASKKARSQDAFRETVESIVVAFVLAFLFRTFIAEAFVIPTGSMAPTLVGRHKDVTCPQCACFYEVGSSVEMNSEGTVLLGRIRDATCPNCRFRAPIKDLLSFKGDRILVNKFPFELGNPQRWDVCVFKYPEEAERNYIKRLVGMPGETIRISRGDVYARQKGAAEFEILRKSDPNKQLAIQILVSDDRLPPKRLIEQGWPERWAGMKKGARDAEDPATIDGWLPDPEAAKTDAARRSHEIAAQDWSWLRYRHYVPSRIDWDAALNGIPVQPPKPSLITDYYAYNTFDLERSDSKQFWVGDLTVSGVAQVSQAGTAPALLLELVEGVRRYRCEIDLKTGTANLSRTDELNPDGPPISLASASTPIRGTGSYRFDFANVDDRLCLWVNGRLIPFGKGAEYAPSALPDPQDGDLTPIGLAAKDATVTFSELVVRRDIYYRADQRIQPGTNQFLSMDEQFEVNDYVGSQLRQQLSNPAEYARIFNEYGQSVEFNQLKDDEYFMLGDNSPESSDSRLWSNNRGAYNRHAVPRHAFVGKAFLIYWPHGIPFLNNGQGFPIAMHQVGANGVENYPAYTFPFYPQFGRFLKRIR